MVLSLTVVFVLSSWGFGFFNIFFSFLSQAKRCFDDESMMWQCFQDYQSSRLPIATSVVVVVV